MPEVIDEAESVYVTRPGEHYAAFIPWLPATAFKALAGDVPETWECAKSAHWLVVRTPTLADIVHLKLVIDDYALDGVLRVVITEHGRNVEVVVKHDSTASERNRNLLYQRGISLV